MNNNFKKKIIPSYIPRKLFQPLPKRQILDSSKLKEFADDNFNFDEKWQKDFQTGRKHCGKRIDCSLCGLVKNNYL